MTFPYYFHLLGHDLHPHAVMEIIAYTGGFQVYRMASRREKAVALPIETRLWVIAGAIVGAAIGAKVLAWAESFQHYWAVINDPRAWLGAKTIVGGLLGGWAGVEVVKKFLHVRGSTGDAYVPGLIFGIAVGRIGCFLTGLPDHTYGNFTTLPWAVDFGDGPRHPTQLYESAFVLLLGVALFIRHRATRNDPRRRAGKLFRLFLAGYLLFRVGVEFIKPTERPLLGLSAIQMASLVGAVVAILSFLRLRVRQASKTAGGLHDHT